MITAELTSGGLARRFTLRLPREASGEIPLVLVLHGNHPEAGEIWLPALRLPSGIRNIWMSNRGRRNPY